MKTSDIRKMSKEEIEKQIVKTKEELFDLRMKKATGTLDQPHRIHELRKDVARMKTILTEMDGSEN